MTITMISVLAAGLLVLAGCSDDHTYGYEFSEQCEETDPAGKSCDSADECPYFTCACADGSEMDVTIRACIFEECQGAAELCAGAGGDGDGMCGEEGWDGDCHSAEE